MEFTLHRDFSDIAASDWNALAAASIADSPFARYEMLSQWWKSLGGGEWQAAELALISASENGKLIGIAPLFKTEYDGRQALLLVGSIEVSDYLDLIVRAEDLSRFLAGLLDYLSKLDAFAGLPLDWYNLPDSSPTLPALKAEAGERAWAYRAEIYRPVPRIPLEGDFDAYLAHIEKKQRHEIRRKMRRAAESEVPVRFHLVGEDDDLGAEVESFFELMAQDPNKASFLKPAMREHMRAVMHSAFANGYLWLAFLTVNGSKAAAALNFDYQNKLWGYNSGVSRDFMELSPGWVLLARQIEWACEHGRSEFDFMRGGEEYKYRFGAVNEYVMRVIVSPHQT